MGRRRARWTPAAVAGRIIWGRGGFHGAVRKSWREWAGPREVARYRLDPQTGKTKADGALRQKRDGTLEFRPPKMNATAKQRTADMRQRTATEPARQTAAPKPMTERVIRESDGTFNGSSPR